MATEIQFGGDSTAFPLWGRDESGYFDLNLSNLRPSLSGRLRAAIDAWVVRWAEVDGGGIEDDDDLVDALVAEARSLAKRVSDELGASYLVSLRWDEMSS